MRLVNPPIRERRNKAIAPYARWISWRHGMTTSAVKNDATAIDAKVMDDRLVVILADDRELAAPLAWFPRRLEATDDQRRNWRLIGGGHGIHWPKVDEDISIASLLRAA
jgi:hypothetical protein